MDRNYIARLPRDEELEKYVYIIRDEKNILLASFKPVEILEYRNYIIPIYFDNPGQQYFVIFNDNEWGNPMCHEDDFLDFIDSKLDYLIPTKNTNVVSKDLSDFSYELLQLIRQYEISDITYLNFKSLQKDINKYLSLTNILLNMIEVKDNEDFSLGNIKYIVKLKEGIYTDDTILEQLKRVIDIINEKENKND